MEHTWVVVADRTRARILVKPRTPTAAGGDWEELPSLVYPEGRSLEQAFNADRPGRSFDSMGKGRHALAKEVSPKEEAAERFAKSVADVLDKARANHMYASLILVAEPGFLGTLQATLSAQTAKMVAEKIPKDLTTRPHKELTAHLRSLLLPQ